jgi:hypothetical protein
VKPVRAYLPFVAVAALAGCGQMSNLQPPPGKPLPVKPAMARATPTAKELLALPPQAKPARVDELIKRSLPRRSDPFDLPPPTGGPAPVLPAGSEETSNQTAPSTPGE